MQQQYGGGYGGQQGGYPPQGGGGGYGQMGGGQIASFGARFGAFILEFVLAIVTLGIGYIIWWLIALGKGQTPGKQILKIRAQGVDGRPCGWGKTFMREFVIKGILGSILAGITFGIYFLLDYLWPLWDDKNQCLHDKIAGTVVVSG